MSSEEEDGAGGAFSFSSATTRVPRGVTRIRFDPSVAAVPPWAFHQRAKLEEIDLRDGPEVIGKGAFSGCKSLRRVAVPSTVRVLERAAFYNCRRMEAVELSEGLERICDSAFERCVSLERISVPSTVWVISDSTMISGGAFQGCRRLGEVELRAGLERIGDDAFGECRSLTSVRVPSTVKVVGRRAFQGCRRLEGVELEEGLERIEGGAFHGCISLARVAVPSSVSAICSRAFKHCNRLAEVKLREGLLNIEESAFGGCSSLKCIKIPSTVMSIPVNTFRNCNQLMAVELCEGLEEMAPGAFQGCTSLKRINIPSTVLSIGRGMFSGLQMLEEVDLCEGLFGIGHDAFRRCTSLKRIKVPSTVKVIGERAFHECEQLANVELCEGLERIGEGAFLGCISLKHIDVPSTVKEILSMSFMGCVRLETVELHGGLVIMETSTFEACRSLKRVRIPSSLNFVPRRAFAGCEELEEVQMLKVHNIANEAFLNCSSLRDIKIPSSVKVVSSKAFMGCEGLMFVGLHEGLKQIGHGAFAGCKSLRQLVVPSTVQIIFGGAFSKCKELRMVKLGEGLDRFDCGLFTSCVSLGRVKIPASVREPGTATFSGCRQLTTAEVQGVMTDFSGCPSLRSIALPRDEARSIFDECHDLMRLFPSQRCIKDAVAGRFEGLSIHELCYYQSFHDTQATLERLKIAFESMVDGSTADGDCIRDQREGLPCAPDEEGDNRDCMGMTPLHILACSTKQNLSLYEVVIANQPESLIARDKWGCVPILYAIWGDSPLNIIRLLAQSQGSLFPHTSLNWNDMIETLCRAGASMEIIQELLTTRDTYFPENAIDWQQVAHEMAVCCLVRCESLNDYLLNWDAMVEALTSSEKHHGLVRCLIDVQDNLFQDRDSADLATICKALTAPLKGWWMHQNDSTLLLIFCSLVKSSIPERLHRLKVKKWQSDIENMLGAIPSTNSDSAMKHLDSMHAKLTSYECEFDRLREATFLLELALWKSKKGYLGLQMYNAGATKGQCRINCGADIIIPNMLPFLMSAPQNLI